MCTCSSLKSGYELGILKEERKEYNPAQLTGRSKVGAHLSLRRLGFLSRCIRFRIVSRRQKAGSLCPAFKSSQSSVSSACLLPRPFHHFHLPHSLSLFVTPLSLASLFLNFLPFHLQISIFHQRQLRSPFLILCHSPLPKQPSYFRVIPRLSISRRVAPSCPRLLVKLLPRFFLPLANKLI